MSAAEQRDSGLHRLSTIEATLSDLARSAARGWAIRAELTYGTLYGRPGRERDVEVVILGSGGGFVRRAEIGQQALLKRLEGATPPDPQVQRGSEDIWPSRWREGST